MLTNVLDILVKTALNVLIFPGVTCAVVRQVLQGRTATQVSQLALFSIPTPFYNLSICELFAISLRGFYFFNFAFGNLIYNKRKEMVVLYITAVKVNLLFRHPCV